MPAVATATAITSHTLIRDPDIQSPFRVVAFVPVSRGSVLKPTAAREAPGAQGGSPLHDFEPQRSSAKHEGNVVQPANAIVSAR
jgi:hypothetical protein